MKKRCLAAIAAVLLLTGCTADVPPDPTQTESAPPPPSTTQAQTQAPDFLETVLVDDANCLVKVTAMGNDSIWGYTLDVYLENKTDEDLMFSVDNASVNGYMCDPFWAVTVKAGMKAKEQVSFSQSDLERSGIREVTDITFTLLAYDSDDWMEARLVEREFTLYPLGEAAARVYPRAPQPEDIVLFDNESCTMIVTGFDPKNMWGYTVNVYLENKTQEDLMFSVNDASVNGFMCDPLWAVTVAAGKKSCTSISWLTSDFEKLGITEVETLRLPVTVYPRSWLADHLVDETFEIRPNGQG